jgi:branched-subunit amino acid aminotransferase/4-amino-4-deoxychorismate lyase
MKTGADRLCMPAPSVEQFLEAVKLTVLANKHWVRMLDISCWITLCDTSLLLTIMFSITGASFW